MAYDDELLKPRIIDVRKITDTQMRVLLEPLERGFGHTLGNALRRILLSSIDGYAVSEVQIEGVLHEYMAIEGVQEDVIDILLNLKELAIIGHKDTAVVTLNKKGVGTVVAKDIKTEDTIEFANPDHVICHLSEKGELNMTLKVIRGRGYKPALRVGRDEDHPIGTLLLDTSFSPVKLISYSIESARVEQRTDLDKLIIDIETNGTIDPQEVIRKAARILHAQLEAFADLEEMKHEEVKPLDFTINSILMRSLEEVGLSRRSINSLKSEYIYRVGDLVQKTESELKRTPNIGMKSLEEIKEMLKENNLQLGMHLENWAPLEPKHDASRGNIFRS